MYNRYDVYDTPDIRDEKKLVGIEGTGAVSKE